MSNDVFISYSRKDEAFIKQLYQTLIARNVSAWYDRQDIDVGNQWASEIVEGIRDCRIFLLVLSPDSAASVNVRKEVDLAQRYEKEIIPLIWRPTEIPIAMEYQLAGIQWIEFNETDSDEKFDQLIEVIQRLGGDAAPAATGGARQTLQTKVTTPASEDRQGKRRLGGLRKKQTVSPIAIGATVISSVVVTFGLDIEDQDFVNKELKWLFHAADHFLNIRQGDVQQTQPIGVSIPETAEVDNGANNQLLATVTDFDLQIWEGQITSGLNRINIHLRNLNILLEQEAMKGEAGRFDVYLQNQIKGGRLEIVRILQEMAQAMKQSYGILVTSPDQLVELLS